MYRVFNFLKKLFGRGKRPNTQIEPPAPPAPQPANRPAIKSLDLNIPDEALENEARFAAYLQERLPFFGEVIKVDYDPGAGSLTLHSRNGDTMTKFLSNALLALREKKGQARARALLNYLNMTEALEGGDELGKVLPVLKSRSFVDVARQQMIQAVKDEPEPPQFVYLDEAENLVRLFVVNGETAVSYVMTTALDGWGIDVGELADTAQDNLYKFLAKTGVQIAKRSQFQYVEIDGQFESSVAFLPKFWAQVQDQSGGAAPIAAFLSRDKVFFTHENDAQGLHLLELISTDLSDVPYVISPDQYRWENGKWSLFKRVARSVQ
ncbi:MULTISPECIES: hypothetical protein [unclassified Rhizobium]|uniref:hypothetical protein n=1 Tax=unclassified Rhizobium TaxID=2613769 RepID=UPI000CDF4212|nr:MULTISPECIES: hypothetical protein [Rhizobium]AVA19892.1 hypothetical protein NXC24_CH00216 [Rhizobium sp. NXC24]UWU23401.1 hypothetical protein N2601_18530 [Rhizobium tropici]